MGKVKYSPEMKEQTVKYVPEGNKSVIHTVAALPSCKKATNPPLESRLYTVTIEIYNDTGIDNIDVIVLSGTTINTISIGNGKAEEIDINDSESFTIKKENMWSDIRGAKKMLMILLAFNFVFGNMLDSDNMPFSIFSCFNSNDITKKKIVYIKEMISIVQEEIVTWYKVAIMQSMLVTGAIIAVAIISCIAIIGAVGKLLTFIILVSALLFAIVLEKKLLKKIMTVKRNLFDMIN